MIKKECKYKINTHFRLTILLVLCSQIGYGQATISLNKQMPVTQVVVTATQEVTLEPGFDAVATGESNFDAKIASSTGTIPFTVLDASVGGSYSSDRNYIRTRAYQKADQSVYSEQIQYFDGLGRAEQTVQRGVTPNGKDLAVLTQYDQFGRAYKQWLPAPMSGNTGVYQDTSTFKSTALSAYSDNRPFTQTIYDNSPLNRVTAQKRVGDAWVGKQVETSYNTNASGVAYYYVNSNNLLQRNGTYAANTLYKTQIADEDGKTATEYKDMLGRVVMKQKGSDVQTYYVYNDLGQLCYVLPPLAADALTASQEYADDADALKQYAYLYKYDERGNIVEKRLPGCDPIYMVYDNANRLILSQDGNQRKKNNWIVMKYDALGRVAYTGTLIQAQTRAQLKTTLDNLLIMESFDGSTSFSSTGYTCNYFQGQITPLIVYYYDNYNFLSSSLLSDYTNYQAVTPPGGYDSPYSNAKGLLTGMRTYYLDNSGKFLTSAIYYNEKGQVVQTRAKNSLGYYDNTYNHYNFANQLLSSLYDYNSGAFYYKIAEIYSYEYDYAGRQTAVNYKLGSNALINLMTCTYDEFGRLIQKNRHGGKDIEQIAYNIRNQPTDLKSGSFEEKLYYNTNLPSVATPCNNGNIAYSTWTYNNVNNGYAYNYDDLNRLTNANYNQETSSHVNSSYNESFDYDKMGNVLSLLRSKDNTVLDNLNFNYVGNLVSSINDDAGSQNTYDIKEYQDYNSSDKDFAYDANGNMLMDLDRRIVTIRYNLLNLPDTIQFSTGNQIVNLYTADGRKLSEEFVTNYTGINIPIGQTQTEKLDADECDSPKSIYIGNCEYYSASGDDLGAYLTKVYNAEGYRQYSTTADGWYYYRKDHLGNNREVWCANTNSTAQRTQYYPSGLPWVSNTDDNPDLQPRKYNGKEFIEMHGYETYDYGARGYYPAMGRFTTIDPLAEKGYDISPYAYCHNNPILFIDPNGLWESTAGGYSTADSKDIEQFMSYIQTEQTVSNKNPDENQMSSFINTVMGGGQPTLSNGSYLLSDVKVRGSSRENNWNIDYSSLNKAWKEGENILSGENSNYNGIFNGMNNLSSVGGLGADVFKATGTLGTIGVWRDFSKIKPYSTGWTGNAAVRTFGVASALGYGMYGLSLIANGGLYFANQQSGVATGLNIGINTLMLRMPLPVSIGYGVGSIASQMQQSAFKTLIDNGYGDNSELFNEDFLH